MEPITRKLTQERLLKLLKDCYEKGTESKKINAIELVEVIKQEVLSLTKDES
ncbi:hypothetical protein [Heyndrickxia acidicola]|uniref:Uncharacterized protein n=1 Tax=Heyndrickxia acidicola TaxID=209389 RepID=A0ABU6MLM8_9BACI|nr:hypothetical protein [Heyndrickxia acidicola]MED1205199.1 hypothetical protein [Heyndrickxia acidicola]